jgi:hypothetical protein
MPDVQQVEAAVGEDDNPPLCAEVPGNAAELRQSQYLSVDPAYGVKHRPHRLRRLRDFEIANRKISLAHEFYLRRCGAGAVPDHSCAARQLGNRNATARIDPGLGRWPGARHLCRNCPRIRPPNTSDANPSILAKPTIRINLTKATGCIDFSTRKYQSTRLICGKILFEAGFHRDPAARLRLWAGRGYGGRASRPDRSRGNACDRLRKPA